MPQYPYQIALWLSHNYSPHLTMKNNTLQMENYLTTRQICNSKVGYNLGIGTRANMIPEFL